MKKFLFIAGLATMIIGVYAAPAFCMTDPVSLTDTAYNANYAEEQAGTAENAAGTQVIAKHIKVYKDYVDEPDIPEKIFFEVNGKTVEGIRAKTEKAVSETYNEPFYVYGSFYGDEDSMYYLFNGKKIPAEDVPEFNNYSEEVLSYLELDPEMYVLDSVQWITENQEQRIPAELMEKVSEENAHFKIALYSGRQKTITYRVTYEGVVWTEKIKSSKADSEEAKNVAAGTDNECHILKPVYWAEQVKSCDAYRCRNNLVSALVTETFSSAAEVFEKIKRHI